MENKYYTPDISEFHVGFEYEALETKSIYSEMMPYDEKDKNNWHWVPIIFGKNAVDNDDVNFDFKYQIHNSFYTRVKYLDKADIESLGFRFLEQKGKGSDLVFELIDYEDEYSMYYLTYFPAGKNLRIFISAKEGYYDYDQYNVFVGKIKNKSELKKVLKQLEIKEDEN